MNNITIKSLIPGILIGAVASAVVYSVILTSTSDTLSIDTGDAQSNVSADEPLYWVAPMDPNFKRDEPGQSPMGMDLVPVYADESAQTSPGTVEIDPVMVQNLGVKTAPINKVVTSQTIKSFGQVYFAQDKISHVHPRVEGWIDKLFVRTEGDPIKQGAPLYSLYSPELVNAQEEYLIALEQNSGALINAAKSRLQALNAPQTLIQAIEKTRKIQRTITYYASQTGVVSELNIQEGFYVKPATTMLAIASLESVWVLADIFASDLNKVKVGDKANIQFDYLASSSVEADLSYIYPNIDPLTRTAKARFVLPNPHYALKPDMYAGVTIQHLSDREILAVTKTAVIRTGSQNRVVLALGKGKYKSIEVELGNSYDDFFEVIYGLEEGDKVVTSAQFLLDSESSITSDFLRFEGAGTAPQQNTAQSAEVIAHKIAQQNTENIAAANDNAENVSAWTQATVNEVMLESRMLNLTHGPLDEFSMMGMTMNFDVAEHLDFEQFEQGQTVHIEVVKGNNGMYQVNTVHFAEEHSPGHSGEQP